MPLTLMMKMKTLLLSDLDSFEGNLESTIMIILIAPQVIAILCEIIGILLMMLTMLLMILLGVRCHEQMTVRWCGLDQNNNVDDETQTHK